jgi:hypothetical protein
VNPSDLAPGFLVLLLGTFVITRSVTKDATGRTLIDRILGQGKSEPAGQLNTAAADAGQTLAGALTTAGTKAADQAKLQPTGVVARQQHGGVAGP